MKEIITKFAIGQEVREVEGGNTLWTDVSNIIKAVIGILGLVCVIVIIIGGVNYMTSSGITLLDGADGSVWQYAE